MLEQIFKDKIKFFEDKKRAIERNIEACNNVIITLDTLGLCGEFVILPSLEDLMWVEFVDNNPVIVEFDRRWIGFPELTEYDHMQDWILAQFGNVNEYIPK